VTAVLFFLSISLSAPAQKKNRLPDSIPGSMENTTVITDTSVAGSDTVTVAGTDTTDTSNQEDTLIRREPATLRAVPDSITTRWKKDRDFAYANDPAYWTRQKEQEEAPGILRSLGKLLSSNGFRYFIYFLMAAILIYAVYRIIAENNLRLFYRKTARSDEKGQEAGPEEEDLDKGLEQALSAGDHRLATRYLYLKALRLLAAKELIRYHPQATNQEYIGQMKELPQGPPFRLLTAAYERVWYGEFTINTTQFEWLMTSFQNFYQSIS
jgi:hypothetical protein